MPTDAKMETVHSGKRVKLYRAKKGVHRLPGLHLWLGPKRGHLRIWPLPWKFSS